jgi:PAS domain S-box-containing protein
MIGRAAYTLFAVLVAALGCTAAVDLYLHGALTIIDPILLGIVGLIGAGVLLAAILGSRAYARYLEGRADRLNQLTSELESVIAALEAANARLNASEARYKGLVDAQGDAILRRTADGRITYANDAFYKLFGLRPDNAIGQPFHPELDPASPPQMLGRLAGREIGRERVSYDQHVKTVAGYRWIAWEDYVIRNADGRLCEIQSVGRDITERKRLEAELTLARDKAEETNRAKSRFLATMSHEIRTPMNGVLGMARLLLETHLKPDQKTYAEAIKQSGLSLLSLIEDILDFSKIESGTLVLEEGEVAIRPLVEGVAELLATRAHSRGIEIVAAIAPDVPDLIKGDGMRLRQVLTNLVGNAVKFTEDGGVLIAVSLQQGAREDPLIRISVRDTGIGVPPDKQTQIFEDFVQADSSQTRRFEGTGLGLSISKRLVEAMGGKIGVMAAEERGSTFWVTLPLEALVPHEERARPLAGKSVAIISQSAILRAGLRLQLQAAGAEVCEARNLKALARQRKPYNLVLIDAPASSEAPFPDMTKFFQPTVALLFPAQRGRLAEIGVKGYHGYLMKPVRQDSLEKRLDAVFAGKTEIETPTAAPQPAQRHGKGLAILLAEDNPVNALLASELLRRRGHTVTGVTTGEAAVTACARKRYDLVVMDLHMPGLDGIEATRRIRLAEADARPVPIFALTADALETGRKACLVAGMDGFLTKPVDPAEIDAVLATIVPSTVVAAE